MSLPFNLQKLPAEAITVLRFLGTRNAAATAQEMDAGLDIGQRSVGRAIRRLVNYSLIQMDFNGAYQLTNDGRRAHQQVIEADFASSGTTADSATFASATNATATAKSSVSATKTARLKRRLTVVMPPAVVSGQPTPLYIGVNPPNDGDLHMLNVAHLELRLSGVGADLSAAQVSIEVPAHGAAAPVKVIVTAHPQVGKVRVRIDAFQMIDLDRIEEAGAMYFDLPVVTHSTPEGSTRKAVGIDLALI